MIDILHQTMYHRNNILTVKLSEKRSKFSIYLRNLSASPSYKTAFYLCLGIANKRKIRITTKLPIWSPNIASIFVNTSPCSLSASAMRTITTNNSFSFFAKGMILTNIHKHFCFSICRKVSPSKIFV